MTVSNEIQKLNAGILIELFELDMRRIGVDSVYKFTTSMEEPTPTTSAYIQWNGESYTPIEIEVDGFEWKGDGAFPTPTLRVSNVLNLFSEFNHLYNDLVGAELIRILTLETFLDTGATPDAGEHLSIDRYRIDRKSIQNRIFVEYELASLVDQEGVQIPKRQFVRDHCSHTYRRWNANTGSYSYDGVTCPYAASPSFDIKGDPCLSENDRCSRKLSTGCLKRYSWPHQENEGGIPIRSFPAMTDVAR